MRSSGDARDHARVAGRCLYGSAHTAQNAGSASECSGSEGSEFADRREVGTLGRCAETSRPLFQEPAGGEPAGGGATVALVSAGTVALVSAGAATGVLVSVGVAAGVGGLTNSG